MADEKYNLRDDLIRRALALANPVVSGMRPSRELYESRAKTAADVAKDIAIYGASMNPAYQTGAALLGMTNPANAGENEFMRQVRHGERQILPPREEPMADVQTRPAEVTLFDKPVERADGGEVSGSLFDIPLEQAFMRVRPGFAAGGLTEEELTLRRRGLADGSSDVAIGGYPGAPAEGYAPSVSQQPNESALTNMDKSNFLTEKLSDITANPGRTAINAVAGFIPGVGPLNTISGLLGGPTIGGAIAGNKPTAAPASPWDRVAPIDLNTAPASKSPGSQAAVDPADLPAPNAQEAGGKGWTKEAVQAAIAQQAAAQKSVPTPWAHAVVASETGGTFDPNLSAKGSSAKGVFQVLTGRTSPWAQFGGKGSPFDPAENARVGTSLMQYNIDLLQKNNLPVTPQTIYALQGMGPAGIKVLQNPDRPVSKTLSNYKSAVGTNSYMAGKTGQQLADWYGSKLSKNTPGFNPNQTLEDWQSQQSQEAQIASTPSNIGQELADKTSEQDTAIQSEDVGDAKSSQQDAQFSISSAPEDYGSVSPQSGATPGGFGFGAFNSSTEPVAPEPPAPPADLPSPIASPTSSNLMPADLKAAADKYFADQDEEQQAQEEQAQQEQNIQSLSDVTPDLGDDDDDGDDGYDGDDGDDGDGDGDGDGGDGDGDGGDGGDGGGDGGGGEKRGGYVISKNKRQRPKSFNIRHAAKAYDSTALRRALAVALKASKRGK